MYRNNTYLYASTTASVSQEHASTSLSQYTATQLEVCHSAEH